MRELNPFTPGFGEEPPYLAGRESEQSDLVDALIRATNRGKGKTIVMYGPRGTGKTVLLNWFEAECSKAEAVAIKATPSRILPSLDALPELLLPENRHRPDKLEAGIGGVKAEWDMRRPGSQRKLEQALIEECKSRPRILLLDEAHTLDPGTCQGLLTLAQEVTEKAPFLLILAGTPGLESFLMSVGATFVERSQTIGVGRLNEQSAAEAIARPLKQDGVSIDSNALTRVVKDAQSYPYFLQLWGEGLWNVAAQRGTTALTEAEVELARPQIEATRTNFYLKRHDTMFADQPLLQAATAVAKAYQSGIGLAREELIDVIENSLPNTLRDEKSRRNEALRLESELNRIDYIWRPPGSIQFEPGILSFMTFVQSQVEQKRQLESGFEKAK